MISGTVFDIQRFSLHDGPGVRTTVFFKGCPLRCRWCHNPEGISPMPQIKFNAASCVGCMDCTHVCHRHTFRDDVHVFSRSDCSGCGKCAKSCAFHALEKVGRRMSVDEIMKTVLSDIPYYKNGGGLTLSGGEPLLQSEFAAALLSAAKTEGVGCAVETSGYAKNEDFLRVASLCDLLLFDYKLCSDELYKEYTGVSNRVIIENLKCASQLGIPVILRCPIIPGVNDNAEHFGAIARTANSLESVFEIHIEPYHTLGLSKADGLGTENMFSAEPLSVAQAESICEKIKELTDKTVKVSK